MTIDKRIFITSDLHFCHDKDFIYKPRGFSNVQDMNKTIIKNFKEKIRDNDILYILGDCFLNNNVEGFNCLKQLPGEKHIIFGNHDTLARIELLKQEEQNANKSNIYCHGYAHLIKYKNYTFYLSHYPTITDNFDNNKPLTKRVINLCGHVHTQDKFLNLKDGCIYHVELDAHNNYPVSLDTIIQDLQEALYPNEKKN